MRKKIVRKNVVLAGLLAACILTNSSLVHCANVVAKETTVEESDTKDNDMISGMSYAWVDKIFSTIEEIHKKDDGRLWGINLHTKAMMVNSENRMLIANSQNKSKTLKKYKKYYVGKLPENFICSNTSADYDGEKWATINYYDKKWISLSDELTLCTHEMFHNVQGDLGFLPKGKDLGYDNKQMETKDGRILIQLEWQALLRAFNASGEKRKQAVADALAFRKERRKRFPDRVRDENKFEIGEGLADYTSFYLTYILYQNNRNNLEKRFRSDYQNNIDIKKTSSLNRAFGYLSGSLYGALLDEYSSDWKKGLRYDSDLGKLLKEKSNIKESAFNQAKKRFKYDKLVQKETKIQKDTSKRAKKYEKMFVKGKHLIAEPESMSIGMDPSQVYTFKNKGSVYEGMAQIVCEWGKVISKNRGLFVDESNCQVIIPMEGVKIKKDSASGNGITISLNKKYCIKKVNKNTWKIVKK